MKIAICGLITSENLGEQFIAKSLEYLIEKELHGIGVQEAVEFVELDILASIHTVRDYRNGVDKRIKTLYAYKKTGLPMECVDILLKKIMRKLNHQNEKNCISTVRHFIWGHAYNYQKRYQLYMEKILKDVDFIVVDGAGLLEYSYNEYHEPLALISRMAEQRHLSVVYNAIGCSGEFNPDDSRCQLLMQALRSECVKYISARDSREIVQQCAGDRLHVKLLADAAFWVNNALRIEPKPGKTIGIGLVRGDALQSYGVEFTDEDWVNLFAEIGYELKKRGYAFQFFVNGFAVDYKIGRRVIEKMQLSSEYLISCPTKPEELLETISRFDCLITCRMHSAIAAVSMKIPSIILSWNQKVDKLMTILGYPERAINMKHFQVEYIVDSMEKARKEGISDKIYQEIRAKALESVRDYIDLIAEAKLDNRRK